MTDDRHVPVLLQQVVDALAVRPDGIYVDATFGRGGHAGEIMKRLGPSGLLLALDRDPVAIESAQNQFGSDTRFRVQQGSFSRMSQMIGHAGASGRVNGILLDLGVSSPQLDDSARGFSFRQDGPLDMRMDPAAGTSAADWVNSAGVEEIARVLREFGEERFARRIARAIVVARSQMSIRTTRQLADIVTAAVPTREPGKDPATRSFQAIRIHINRELEELRTALPQARDALAPGGRLAVISFHSLEDRIVKDFMRRGMRGGDIPEDLPLREDQLPVSLRVIGKPVRPDDAEISRNPRARSAVLRVAERVGGAHV